ncbi:hypothetical protein, partial [Caballeronia sp. M23-90]
PPRLAQYGMLAVNIVSPLQFYVVALPLGAKPEISALRRSIDAARNAPDARTPANLKWVLKITL